ncbi:MAG TPA: hypothetical protein VMU85_15300 [Stellaceae bacterium]|nr:hypothetical protein [Stellaceae bacterium]
MKGGSVQMEITRNSARDGVPAPQPPHGPTDWLVIAAGAALGLAIALLVATCSPESAVLFAAALGT